MALYKTDAEGKLIKIAGKGDTPNMVTTDTNQTITGTKKFSSPMYVKNIWSVNKNAMLLYQSDTEDAPIGCGTTGYQLILSGKTILMQSPGRPKFSQTGSGGTVHNLAYLDEIHPVGSIYLSVNDTSPAILFGGSWERLENRFLLGAGSSYTAGAEGGSKDAVAVSHNHEITQNVGGTLTYNNNGVIYGNGWTQNPASSTGNITVTSNYNNAVGNWAGGGNAQRGRNVGATYQIKDVALASAGIDGTDKNMPPYLAVYMWKRIS